MTRDELKIRIEMHEKELDRLRTITVRCHSCMFFGPRGLCDKWGEQVPPEVQPVGCDSWTHDNVPF